MNQSELFADLLQLLGSTNASSLILGHDNVIEWPNDIFDILLKAGLLIEYTPADTTVCNGCEESCLMSVHLVSGQYPRAFIICDKRDDTARVQVNLEQLKQWQISKAAIARKLIEAADDHPAIENLVYENLSKLPLHKIVVLKDGELDINTERLVSSLSADNTPLNQMILIGDHWEITFEGKRLTFKNSKGLRYIEYLLRNQGREIHAIELHRSINPPDTSITSSNYSNMNKEQLTELNLTLDSLGDSGNSLDDTTIRQARARLKDIDEDLEDADCPIDIEQQQKLLEERDQINAYLASNLGLNNRKRKSSDNHKRMVDSISKCIRDDIKKIKRLLPSLGEHLECISFGTIYKYAPHPRIDWVLNSHTI